MKTGQTGEQQQNGKKRSGNEVMDLNDTLERISSKKKLKVYDSVDSVVERSKDDIQAEPEMLYHIGLRADRAKEVFGDVEYICVGGTEGRMKDMADMIAERLKVENKEICKGRFVVFKVGKIICANHGMGAPSASILMTEIIKGLKLADNIENISMIRIGTTGGIGVEPGECVVTTDVLNERLQPFYETIYLGKDVKYPTKVDPDLVDTLSKHKYATRGKTMSANCFYDNQGRLDGAFHDHSAQDRQDFLDRLKNAGVKNIEMEAVTLSALATRAGIKVAVVCMVLVNRLKGDAVRHIMHRNRAMDVVCDFFEEKCSSSSIN